MFSRFSHLLVGAIVVAMAESANAQLKFSDGTTQRTAFGGSNSTTTGTNATVAGGADNSATGAFSVVAGGSTNSATGEASTVAGGFSNQATKIDSTVAGGSENAASGTAAFIGGGSQNIASGNYSVATGGLTNESADFYSSIGGGNLNFSAGDSSTISGGFFNDATNLDSVVGGGSENIASGVAATIPGGSQNTAAGDLSIAAGFGATVDALHDGAMLFADSRLFFFFSARANEFAVRATGGVRLVTGVNANQNGVPNAGVVLNPGGGTWLSLSDRNAKENLSPVDGRAVLEKVAGLPLNEWNYKTQDASERHLGPMAQDFRAAFGLGPDDTHIADIDLGGVALAAIQGLYTQMQEENARLKAELDTKSKAMESMQRQLDEIAARLNAPAH
jgi:hypothetical protein